jgi:hypothetical protein
MLDILCIVAGPDVQSLSFTTLGPIASFMATRWSARAGFMGSPTHLPVLTRTTRKMRCALRGSLPQAGVSMAAIRMRSSRTAADGEKRRMRENRTSRTTSTPRTYDLHPSGAADVRRPSASTSAPGTILDYGSSTGGNVQASSR